MAIDRKKLRDDIISRANVAGMKAGAPELYHLVVLLLAYVDNDYSGVVEDEKGGWYKGKTEAELTGKR